MSKWKDILADEEHLSNEELLRYLHKDISEEERHRLEKKLTENSFEKDAIEGLKSIKNEKQLTLYVKQLNNKLHEQLQGKKKLKEKRKINSFEWTVLAVIILLFICIVSYLIITMQQR